MKDIFIVRLDHTDEEGRVLSSQYAVTGEEVRTGKLDVLHLAFQKARRDLVESRRKQLEG